MSNLELLMASEEQARAYAQGYRDGRRSAVAEVRERVMRTNATRRTPNDRRASWFFRRSDIALRRGDTKRAEQLEQWAIEAASRRERETR